MERQRQGALERANAVRSQRARLKEQLRDGSLLPREVLEDLPDVLFTARVGEFLTWVPGIGPKMAATLCNRLHLPVGVRLVNLSESTRRRVLEVAEERYSRARVRRSPAASSVPSITTNRAA